MVPTLSTLETWHEGGGGGVWVAGTCTHAQLHWCEWMVFTLTAIPYACARSSTRTSGVCLSRGLWCLRTKLHLPIARMAQFETGCGPVVGCSPRVGDPWINQSFTIVNHWREFWYQWVGILAVTNTYNSLCSSPDDNLVLYAKIYDSDDQSQELL